MDDIIWNPWHGCHKYSEGCTNCYVYRRDESIGKDASIVTKTTAFDMPLKKKRNGEYKIPSGASVFCCMTSDFFVEDADSWREEIWNMIRERQDVHFSIITKRILRFSDCVPSDWGDGYKNVSILCTMENQKQCDIRFPVFNRLPIAEKYVICEPLLGPIDMRSYLSPAVKQVTAGGESGNNARLCDYDWILDIRQQCAEAGVHFWFKQTGARFKKDGKIYRILRKHQHAQARKAGINL